MISDKEMRKRIADMSPQELLKASETFEALFDLVHQHDDNSIAKTNPDYYKQELARLNAERRWIPVSEPPKVKGEYICYSKPDIFTCFFGDSWDGGLAFRSVIQPTHWMPLPEPPEEK